MKLAFIGTGRLGTSLAGALAARGYSIAGLYDIDRSAARRCRRRIGRGFVAGSAEQAAGAADVVLLCVPDEAVPAAAARLARAPLAWKGKAVLHTSGALSSKSLAPLRKAGARTGSFHPAQSLAGADAPASSFRGVRFAVEGPAAPVGRRLARSLGGIPFTIGAAAKPLYHAACAATSNLLVPLFDAACGLLEDAGLGAAEASGILLPLLEGTVRNLKTRGRRESLTGPIARGDAATVALHLRALRGHSEARKIYKILGKSALRLAASNGLAPDRVRALRRLLAGK